MAAEQRLPVRPSEGRVLAGVCAALAGHFDRDVRAFRLAALLLLCTGIGFPVYVAMWLVFPAEGGPA